MAVLRVLKILASSERGGAEENFLALARALAARGVEIAIACDEGGPLVSEFTSVAAKVLSLPLSYPTHVASIRRLRHFIRDVKPDVVHTHLWNADVLGGLAAWREGVPFVSTVTGPYFLPLHPRAIVRWRRSIYSNGFRAIYRLCDLVIACSEELAHDLAERPGLKVPRSRIRKVYNGLDLELLERRASDALPPSLRARPRHRIAMAANFYPIKGHETLIEALPQLYAAYPELQVVFAGDGPDRPRLEDRVRQLGFEGRVVFTGNIPNAVALMRESDVVTLPSNGEGLPMVLLEAMALGRAVVATRVGGIPELIAHGRTGMLVAPRDGSALAKSVIAVLGDTDKRRALGEAAKAEVREKWTSSATAAGALDVYREVLA